MAQENKNFAEATITKSKSSHTYEADFCDSWCIGSGKASLEQLKKIPLTDL
jgi:hypothetical protein